MSFERRFVNRSPESVGRFFVQHKSFLDTTTSPMQTTKVRTSIDNVALSWRNAQRRRLYKALLLIATIIMLFLSIDVFFTHSLLARITARLLIPTLAIDAHMRYSKFGEPLVFPEETPYYRSVLALTRSEIHTLTRIGELMAIFGVLSAVAYLLLFIWRLPKVPTFTTTQQKAPLNVSMRLADLRSTISLNKSAPTLVRDTSLLDSMFSTSTHSVVNSSSRAFYDDSHITRVSAASQTRRLSVPQLVRTQSARALAQDDEFVELSYRSAPAFIETDKSFDASWRSHASLGSNRTIEGPYELSFNDSLPSRFASLLFDRDVRALCDTSTQRPTVERDSTSSERRSMSRSVTRALRSTSSPKDMDTFDMSTIDINVLIKKFKLATPTKVDEQLLQSRYELSYSQLYTAARRLRQWIAVTIVRRLMSEIDKCNSELAQYPLTPRIGVDGADTIEAAAATVYVLGADDLAERICGIVSYLRPVAYSTDGATRTALSAQQVVTRCRVLSKDVTMHEYAESDAAIVLHLFATYLDRVAPPHPIHRKKAFTSTGIYFEGVDTVDIQYVHPMSYYLVVPKKVTTTKEESHTPLRLYIASSGGKQVLSMNGIDARYSLFCTLALLVRHCQFYARNERLPGSIDAMISVCSSLLKLLIPQMNSLRRSAERSHNSLKGKSFPRDELFCCHQLKVSSNRATTDAR